MLASTAQSSLKRFRSRLPCPTRTAVARISQTCSRPNQLTRNEYNPFPDSGLRSKPFAFESDYSNLSRSHTSLSQFNSRISEAADRGDIDKAFRGAAEMKEAKIQPNITTYHSLLKLCALDERPLDALAILEDMVLVGIQPDALSFNYAIDANRSRASTFIWFLMHRMRELNVEPNGTTYSIIIQHFTSAGNLELSLRYYELLRQTKQVDLRSVQNVIALAARQGFPRLALDLAIEFEETSVRRLEPQTWIDCLTSAADELWADGVLDCWKVVVSELGIVPDEGLFMRVINTAARNGLSDLASDVLSVMQMSEIPWNEAHIAALFDSFVASEDPKGAFATLGIMRAYNIEAGYGTVRSLVDVFAKDTDTLDTVWTYLDDIREAHNTVDVSALNIVVEAAARLGDLQRVVGAYQSFSEYGAVPDRNTFDIFLGAVESAGRIDMLGQVVQEMQTHNIPIDGPSYEQMIQLYLAQPQYIYAFAVLEEMKTANLKPSKNIYEAIANKCVNSGDTRYIEILKEMEESGVAVSPLYKRNLDNRFREVTGIGIVEGAAGRLMAQIPSS